MTYISNGTLHQKQPWGINKIISFVWTVVDCIIAFFVTLIPGLWQRPRTTSSFRVGGGSRSGWGGGGGGGGGGSGGGGWFGGGSDRPRKPPRPPASNVRGMDSIRPPPGPPPCTSCCG